ncbi:uncharacterized protein [Physcomitrium patens]|uniref:Uncharacterized protein n=1 Tax=Physcomitrium patens TaxID=3218 RepID=A0A2K1L157_PHYPA|nr:uncharacterized protein LOC112278749 [Physcomitrium patens]PNR59755.1 hypothetical protein PHYPA_002547 [Physcomitrium patens]|eukprot:XP_024368231.1 uncharacterized protein LOC112278749 [Physcomitrella patens]
MLASVFSPRVVVARDGALRCDSLSVGRVTGLGLVWKDRGRFSEGNVGWCGRVERIDRDGELGTRRRRGWAVAAEGDESREVLDVGRDQEASTKSLTSFWKDWQMSSGKLREKITKLGRAGLLAYGLFNGITYTTFFFIAFLAFEKSTGQNPANNLKACLGGMISMWTGNNFTRPLRVAGAAALAPFMDKVLKKTQKTLKLQDEASAFLFLVILLIVLCGSAVGLLILSRMGTGQMKFN